MIGLKFLQGQGLGNQLWNYVACRFIADRNRYNFSIFNKNQFKGKDFLKINYGKSAEIKNFLLVKENLYYDLKLNWISSGYDPKFGVLAKKTLIQGLFQDEKYFYNKTNNIKSYITLKSENKFKFDDFTCILNIRGGEYKRHKELILPKVYWDNAILYMKKNFEIKNFLIVTDDYRYAKSLFPNFEIISSSIENCFKALMSVKYLINSNSSFSYFPIKLGIKKQFIIAPKYWARFNNKYNRWASISNLYKGWHWMDGKNKIFTYKSCLKERDKLEHFYYNNYNLSFDNSYFDDSGIRKYFPRTFRYNLKKLLSFFFPKYIG
jgi:hypothetical protein